MKKPNLNKTLFQIHLLQLANEWDNIWHLLYDAIQLSLENEILTNIWIKKLDRMKQLQNTIKTRTSPHKFHPRVIKNANIAFSENEINIHQKGFKFNCNFKLKKKGLKVA